MPSRNHSRVTALGFVLSQAYESDVADVIGIRPLEKLEIRDQLRLNPDALSHLLGSESLARSATLRFRKIRERTSLDNQRLQPGVQFAPGSRNGSGRAI
jgi:hypothetical protein